MDVSVSPSFFARPRHSLQPWKDTLQVLRNFPNALALGSHGQQLLLEIQVERKRSRQIKRKLVLISRR